MPKIWNFQSNMNRGELDPLLSGRLDLQAYYNGVELGKNVLALPQGGMKKRPGTEYIGDLPGSGRLENFSFNTEQNYLLAFTDFQMRIYKDGVKQLNINGTGDDHLDVPWTDAQLQITEFDYIQSKDTIIITHPDIQPKTITRTSDTTWIIASISFTNIPQFDFNDGSSPTPVSEIQTLTFSNHAEGDRYKLALNGLLTEELVFAGDDSTNEENIRFALQALVNTPNDGISVAVLAAGVSFTVTFANDSANPWDLLTGTAVSTISSSFAVAAARTQTGVSRSEDSWSALRGWPSTCTFHEGRLWVGGSESRPTTIFGSRPFDFFNFDKGRGLDDEGIETVIDTDQANAIESIFSNRTLQIFTGGSEFYVSESPITPANVAVKPQTNMGSKRVRPVSIDGVTLFVQRTGKSIIRFIYLDEFQANQSKSVSLQASHLIKDPIKIVSSSGTESVDANYVYIVNADGTITVFNTLESEDVSGYTRWITADDSTGAGIIRSSAIVENFLYLLVQREINGATAYYIEKENTDFNTDSAVADTTDDNEITGLSHLEGETVWAKADGAFMGEFTVSAGKITLDRTSDDKEAGLAFLPEITTMPLNIGLQNGPNASSKKKIGRVTLRLYESNGVLVNDERIADKTIGVDQFSAPIPQTGLVRMHLLGWSLDAQITITQDTPMPMTILQIGMEVAT